MRTLYLADLDGTLLNPDQRVSEPSARLLNALIGRGCLLSYATARSLETSRAVTASIRFQSPVIVHNGAVTADPVLMRPLTVERFSEGEKGELLSAFLGHGLVPITYSFIGAKNRFSYIWERSGAVQRSFILTRTGSAAGSERARKVYSPKELLSGDVFYFACLGEKEALAPVYEALQAKYRCFFAPDIYLKAQWLEIVKRGVSKAAAALALKERLGAERLVVFGDAENDIPLFEIADERYAVQNAVPALKQMATQVIGSNSTDAVARTIQHLFEGEQA